ncbi:MAG: hypothetical protein JKY87_08265, partial [Mariprofundus sp.]|nr:hypothetical protein [Mariprofundus sp.]
KYKVESFTFADGTSLTSTEMNEMGNIIYGTDGANTITGFSDNNTFYGLGGNDTINTGLGADTIIFNAGDGQDIVNASTGADNTLTLGDNINASDLSFSHSGNNLVVNVGISDQITFRDWYASANNHSVASLELKSNGQTVDFSGMVTEFDQSGVTDYWALTNTLLDSHLLSTSNDANDMGGALGSQHTLTGRVDPLSSSVFLNSLAAQNTAQTP